MSTRKTLEQQIAQAQAEIQQRENRLKGLLNKQKDKERKERNHRLCKRMGLIEKYLPDTIPLTDEQFVAFIDEAVANDYGRRKLAFIMSQGAEKYPPKSMDKVSTNSTTANTKPENAISLQDGADKNESQVIETESAQGNDATAIPTEITSMQSNPLPSKLTELPPSQGNANNAKSSEAKTNANRVASPTGGNNASKAG